MRGGGSEGRGEGLGSGGGIGLRDAGPALEVHALLDQGDEAPIGWSIGFVAAPFVQVLESLISWRRAQGIAVEVRRNVPAFPGCLRALDPLESPWTTELLVGHGPAWTLYLNNHVNGGDPAPTTSYLAEIMAVRAVIAVHQPMTPLGYASTQFRLVAPGAPAGEFERALIAHAQENRWSWHSSGALLPFERPEAYLLEEIPARLTRPILVGYLRELGISVDDEARYQDVALISQRPSGPVSLQTLAEARALWHLE